MIFRLLGSVFGALLLGACVEHSSSTSGPFYGPLDPPFPEKLTYRKVDIKDLKGFTQDNTALVLPMLQMSCRHKTYDSMESLDPDLLPFDPSALSVAYKKLCPKIIKLPKDCQKIRNFLEQNFDMLDIQSTHRPEGLITGYVDYTVRGCLKPTKNCHVPVYGLPPVHDRSYSRDRIDQGALKDKGLEIAWVYDPVDLFFLQVQGSGRLRLDDGQIFSLHYAGKNGQPYFPIARYLVAKGYLTKETASMETVRLWMQLHPDKAVDLMHMNPSYVYFSLKSVSSPKGAQGISLVGGRSLAVDNRYIPYGSPLWVDTAHPMARRSAVALPPLRQLMVAQDRGGRIKGPRRADIFFGAGPEAEHMAGHMANPGRLYLFVPKGILVK